jgi:anti-sigma-K factor RskA
LITSLELRHEAEIIDLEEIVRLMRHQVQEQVGITNSLQEQILFEQGETRRERRWKKIWKGATVVVTVTAATVVTIISLK